MDEVGFLRLDLRLPAHLSGVEWGLSWPERYARAKPRPDMDGWALSRGVAWAVQRVPMLHWKFWLGPFAQPQAHGHCPP